MPLIQFVRQLSNQTGVSIVVEARLDQQSVTADFRGETVDQILDVVSRRLGVEVTRLGQVYYLGTLKREDLGVLVRRVRRLTADELSECVRVLQSDKGSLAAFDDGLLVIGDRVEVLARIDDLLSQVEAADSATWVLQLYLVSLEDAALRDLGFDARPSLDVAATFASASMGVTPGAASALALSGGLNSVLTAASTNSNAHLVAEPLFLLLDGSKSEFSRGDVVPVPQRAISEQGTVTTTGFTNMKTGLVCAVELREMRAATARLTVDVSMSDIVRFVEFAPVTREDRFTTSAEVQSGGVYLLGSLVRQADQSQILGALQIRNTQNRTDTVMQVWARAYRVGGSVQQETPGDSLPGVGELNDVR